MSRPVTPALTVDIIIELKNVPLRPIVLIERKYPPLGWAIPGGFVDVGETIETAARREALEETHLQVDLLKLLGVYSNPHRDPRGHTVSLVYIAEATGEPVADDDAKSVAIYVLDALPAAYTFDHHVILQDYRHYRETGMLPNVS